MILSLRLTHHSFPYTSDRRFFFLDFTPNSSPSSSASRSGSERNLFVTPRHRCAHLDGLRRHLVLLAAHHRRHLTDDAVRDAALSVALEHGAEAVRDDGRDLLVSKREQESRGALGGDEGNDGLAHGIGEIELVMVHQEVAQTLHGQNRLLLLVLALVLARIHERLHVTLPLRVGVQTNGVEGHQTLLVVPQLPHLLLQLPFSLLFRRDVDRIVLRVIA